MTIQDAKKLVARYGAAVDAYKDYCDVAHGPINANEVKRLRTECQESRAALVAALVSNG